MSPVPAREPCRHQFCGQCGARLAASCAACGAGNPPTNKFCGKCGAPLIRRSRVTDLRHPSLTPKHLAKKILTSKSALEGERKQVTVLFADLKGSMELLADRDPEEARQDPRPGARAHDGGRASIRGHGQPGDGRRNHGSLRRTPGTRGPCGAACYAALQMQESAKRYAERVRREHGVTLRIRVGLNSGEVVVRSMGRIFAWTTRPSGRRPTSPLGWNSSPIRAPYSSPLTLWRLPTASCR